MQYLLQGEACRGAELVTVPSPDGVRVDLDALLDSIDERTRLVPISHVLFRSAYVQDAEKIAARCRETGALLLLDTYQSAGVLPLELETWGVDAAVGGCLKWLCGGPGNAFLWVRPELGERLEPRLHRLAVRRRALRLPQRAPTSRERRLALSHRDAQHPGLTRRPCADSVILGRLDSSELRSRSPS